MKPVMSEIEGDMLKTIDRQADFALYAATLKDMRQRLTQGHQMVSVG